MYATVRRRRQFRLQRDRERGPGDAKTGTWHTAVADASASSADLVALILARRDAATVVRGALPAASRDWSGAVLAQTSKQPMAFYPGGSDDVDGGAAAVFSERSAASRRTIVKPSAAYWQWLRRCALPWQMRSALALGTDPAAHVEALAGAGVGAALRAGRARLHSASVWAGGGGCRTPLHVDEIDGLLFQVCGSKRLVLAARADVHAACAAGALPSAVAESGNTDDFLVAGDLAAVYGLGEAAGTRLQRAQVVTLHPGDCLLIPAGVYHDVQSETAAAVSLTVRVEHGPFPAPPAAAAANGGSYAARVARAASPPATPKRRDEAETATAATAAIAKWKKKEAPAAAAAATPSRPADTEDRVNALIAKWKASPRPKSPGPNSGPTPGTKSAFLRSPPKAGASSPPMTP